MFVFEVPGRLSPTNQHLRRRKRCESHKADYPKTKVFASIGICNVSLLFDMEWQLLILWDIMGFFEFESPLERVPSCRRFVLEAPLFQWCVDCVCSVTAIWKSCFFLSFCSSNLFLCKSSIIIIAVRPACGARFSGETSERL